MIVQRFEEWRAGRKKPPLPHAPGAGVPAE